MANPTQALPRNGIPCGGGTVRATLTEKRAKEIAAPESGEVLVYDEDFAGLVLRVRPGGSKAWYLKKWIGRQFNIALGSWPEIPVELARELAAEALVQLKRGTNPTEEKRKAAAAARGGKVPILDVLERRLAKLDERGRSGKHVRELARIAREAHEAGIRDLCDAGIAAKAARWLGKLDISDQTRMRYRRHLVALGREAMKWFPADVLRREPFLALGGEGAAMPAPPYFIPSECCTLASDASIAQEETGGLLWAVLLYSGCRYREISWLTWDRVDLARKTIAIIPPSDAERAAGAAVKRDKARTIPMHDELVALLSPRIGKGFIFDSWWRERDHIRYVEQFRAHLALPVVNIPLNGRRIHSLRHSHAILAIACGVDSLHLRLSMGHAGPEMQAHYASAAMRFRGVLASWNGQFHLRDAAEVERLTGAA